MFYSSLKKIIVGLSYLTLITCSQIGFDFEASAGNVVRKIEVTNNSIGGVANTEPIKVKLAPGYGVNLSFLPINEVIEKAWLDNPGFVTIDFDGCLENNSSGVGNNCNNNATIVHLRRINNLDIQGLPKTNSTLLTVVTRSVSGSRRLYLFKVIKVKHPAELVIELVPNTPSQPPVQLARERTVKRSPDLLLIDAIERGIKKAKTDKTLTENSELDGRLLRFLSLLRLGTPVTEAASNAGISRQLVEHLKSTGNYLDVPAILGTSEN